MISKIIDKLLEHVINDTHDKLTETIIRISNLIIQLFIGVLVIFYSFQSFVIWSNQVDILTNELYLKYVEKYLNMANSFAFIGSKVFSGLLLFGIVLFIVSYFIWLIFANIAKKIKIGTFFIGEFLIILSIGCTFWSFVFYILLTVEVQFKKYFILALPLTILFLFLLNMVTKKINAIGRN
ncbi:hypothetical protein COF54_16895 [Bacillus toyonensis]|uniref:hypothetical protein n=1 Tax=Bacillus toyonensis TaxID=155322 RepID=UPI000BFE51D9|nr:hypothetical protein [Bacillus toyonensis]PHD05733.1 hypothetical protein COF54_16895 [Bacillus toyonensis]